MKYYINPNLKQSAYLQLYSQLRKDITEGVYRYGERLPSKRLLAEETMTSVITVEHTYAILCDEGYAHARERSGYFVTYREGDFVPIGEQDRLKTDFSEVYPHSEEEFPFSVFAKTMRSVISKYGDRILVKSPNAGSPELRDQVCGHYRHVSV